jgi:hypothetical protein
VPLPKAYSGDEDIEQFDGWLHSMLWWMKINHYAGPECEHDRITLTAMYLDEKAKTWFNDNVEGVNHQSGCGHSKTSSQVCMIGSYTSCLFRTLQKFYSVKYTTDGGVFRFYHELKRYTSRMIHEPNSYTFNTQLMMGLLSSMIQSVVDKGMTAETSSLNKILHMAKHVEEGTKVLQQYDDRHRARVTNPSHPVHVAQPSRPSLTSSQPVQGTRSTLAPVSHSKSQAPE